MRKLTVFNQISVDGFFASSTGDVSWTHRGPQDPEFNAYVEGNASGGGCLVFGRKTYEMMASFWPTDMAAKQFPVVAKKMNELSKIVFSRTLDAATWTNTTLVKGDLVAEMKRLKSENGPGMTILGSGSLVAQLSRAGLVDQYTFCVLPIILGRGRTMFDGVEAAIDLDLTSTRAFKNGNAILVYQPRG